VTQTTAARPGTDQTARRAHAAGSATSPAGAADRARVARRRLRGRVRSAFEGTPGKLRTAALVGVLVCLVFAVAGGNAFRARGDALDEARNSAAQLVRVQQIATDLTQADAIVTNAFLLGAGEPVGAYGQFQEKVADASRQLVEASRAQPGDAGALAIVNDGLSRYTAAVAAARANNRLGYQVGSGYLREASDLLRLTKPGRPAMLDTLQNVVDADAARVEDAFDAARWALVELAVAAVVVLAGLGGVQAWLARRTRRIFNIPLTWGTGAVLVTVILGALAMLASQGAADTVHDTHYAATKALSQARIAAFDGKANESLTLVYQGSGQTQEATYQTDLKTARAQLSAARDAGVADAGGSQLNAWDAVHQQIRQLDNAGNWTGAVALATGKSTQTFQGFDTTTASALKDEAGAVSGGLTSTHWLLVLLGWLTLVVGLVAMALAWAGVSQRLGEYR
jgi:hypothetical protein